MKIARVIGSLVSTIKHEDHTGRKLLWVQPVDLDGRPVAGAFVAIDSAQAGVGDYVLVMEEGKGARQILDSQTTPCEALIVGVIDHLSCRGVLRVLGAPAG